MSLSPTRKEQHCPTANKKKTTAKRWQREPEEAKRNQAQPTASEAKRSHAKPSEAAKAKSKSEPSNSGLRFGDSGVPRLWLGHFGNSNFLLQGHYVGCHVLVLSIALHMYHYCMRHGMVAWRHATEYGRGQALGLDRGGAYV